MVDNLYEKLSDERKHGIASGNYPDWFTTGGYQLFKSKYLYDAEGFRGQAERIAVTAAKHTDQPDLYKEKFFSLIWNGWLSCSTPVLANMGTNRGLQYRAQEE